MVDTTSRLFILLVHRACNTKQIFISSIAKHNFNCCQQLNYAEFSVELHLLPIELNAYHVCTNQSDSIVEANKI